MTKYKLLLFESNNKYNIKIINYSNKINIKIYNDFMLTMNKNFKNFKINTLHNKYENFYFTKNNNKTYDYIIAFNVLLIKKIYKELLSDDLNIITNLILFDKIDISNTVNLRRIYIGNTSRLYDIKIPYQDNRAEKLLNNYNVYFNKNFKVNKNGVIVIAPNCLTSNWYKKNKKTLGNISEIKRIIDIIKNNSNLDIEIRLHPKDKKINFNKYNIKINTDDLDTLSDRAYCIICDRSSIGTKLYFKGNLIFNFQSNYKYSIIGNICLTNPSLLNPNNLNIDNLCFKKIYEYLKEISMISYTYDEINSGYLFKLLYPVLVEYKNKVLKINHLKV